MSESFSELEKKTRALSPEERAQLAEILLESLEATPAGDVEAAWNQEIGMRAAAYERGELEVFAAEAVFAEARRITR